MTTAYVTAFDIAYLPRAWTLYQSLKPWLQGRRMVFCCLDEMSARLLEHLAPDNAVIARHDEFVSADLRRHHGQWPANEYAWAAKADAVAFAFGLDFAPDWSIWLDSDMAAFADPDQGLVADAAAVFTPHRFSPRFLAYAPEVGEYNSGYAAFANRAEGHRAVRWWRDQCINRGCSARPSPGQYGDQYYLTEMAGVLPGIVASPHPGLNVAPWNLETHPIHVQDDRVVMDDGRPVLLYHFQALRLYHWGLSNLYPGDMKLSNAAVQALYRPYVAGIRRALADIRAVAPGFDHGVQSLSWRLGVGHLAAVLRRRPRNWCLE